MVANPGCHITSNAKLRQILLGAILLSLAANLIYPGEVFFQSKFLFTIVSIFVFLVTLVSEHRLGKSKQAITLVVIVFLPLFFLLPSVLITINAARSQEVFCLFFAYACLFVALQFLRGDQAELVLCLLFLTLTALCIDLFSLYQYLFGLSDLKTLILHSTALDEKLKSGVLTRISTKRVFANFPLPNTLAGFVAMILPINLFLLYLALQIKSHVVFESMRFLNSLFRSRLFHVALFIELWLSLLVLTLTQSFGGWVCLCAATALLSIWLIAHSKISVTLSIGTLSVLLLIAAGWLSWVTYQRGFSLWNLAAAENPIVLRWNNYKTAIQIFRDFPESGVGLGNYGSINPRYQSSPATVAQYAHNTFLQLLSESGILLVAFVLLALVGLARFWSNLLNQLLPGEDSAGFMKVCIEASLMAWLVHNLLDIDFYFPSVGGLGVFLLGLLASSRQEGNEPRYVLALIRRVPLAVTTILAAASLAALFVVRIYLAESLCSLALNYGEAKDFEQAQRLMDQAVSIQRNDAAKVILQAKLRYLSAQQKQHVGTAQLIMLREAYWKATQLDPFNANYHHEFSRILFALGETNLALQSQARATELFPSEPKFRQNPNLPYPAEPNRNF